MKNIVLIGFMGTGKTSTGKTLAARLGFSFLDLDEAIEQTAGMTIPAIFEQFGEEGFRAREREAVKRAAERRNTVISTGGGTVKSAENIARPSSSCSPSARASMRAPTTRSIRANGRRSKSSMTS